MYIWQERWDKNATTKEILMICAYLQIDNFSKWTNEISVVPEYVFLVSNRNVFQTFSKKFGKFWQSASCTTWVWVLSSNVGSDPSNLLRPVRSVKKSCYDYNRNSFTWFTKYVNSLNISKRSFLILPTSPGRVPVRLLLSSENRNMKI